MSSANTSWQDHFDGEQGTTHAHNQGISETYIAWINRWRSGKEEQVVAGRTRVVYYSEKKQLIQMFMLFSRAM
jgi:hypothetical protein